MNFFYDGHPLRGIREYTQLDYKVFKERLRLPKPFLYFIFRNNGSLSTAAKNLPKLLGTFMDYNRKHYDGAGVPDHKRFALAGIPVQWYKDEPYELLKKSEQPTYDFLIENVKDLAESGYTFYFHSEFEDAAMRAATDILRRAIRSRIKCYCTTFPTLLEEIKTWESDNPVVKKVEEAGIVLLWAIGSEHITEFTKAQLNHVIRTRAAAGKSTILVTHLTPKDYKSRYGKAPDGVVVGFKDEQIQKTLADVKAMLEAKRKEG